MIDELITLCADKVGLSQDQSRIGLSAALALIQKHADPDKAAALMAAIPGSAELATEGATMTENKPRGLLGGLVKGVGGAGGAAMSDAMTINQHLTREGINLSDMQAILPVAMTFVQEKAGGQDLLREVLLSIPGLGPLMTAQG